ncbi:MAG TPA: hypothetical protein VI855_06495 [Dehalococcoidia bacterium]|nr:hypothetical protein [Dehalococcoidia bacterium]
MESASLKSRTPVARSLGTSPNAQEMSRIVVVGSISAGKTTFSRRLAQTFGVPHVEWDGLRFARPEALADSQLFSPIVREAITPERWVFDGLYTRNWQIMEMVAGRATMVIWLNYAYPLVLWRVVKRSVSVGLQKPTLRGKASGLLDRFFSRQSRPLRVTRTFQQRRKYIHTVLDAPVARHLKIIEFRKPEEAEEFLRGLKVHQPQVS